MTSFFNHFLSQTREDKEVIQQKVMKILIWSTFRCENGCDMSEEKQETYRQEISDILSSLRGVEEGERQKIQDVLNDLSTKKAVLVLKELVMAGDQRQSVMREIL